MRAAMRATRHAELLDSREWDSTPLGSFDTWPEELRFAVTTVMPSGVPMMIWWGPDLIQIYNEAYVPLLGNKHPDSMGQPAEECWSEAWGSLRPSVLGVLATGRASFEEFLPLWIDRHGFLEETHWSLSLSPIRQHGTGDILGLLCATTEKTDDVITKRRLRSLRRLGEVSTAQGTVEASDAAMESMTGEDVDIRAMGLYCAEEPDSDPERIAWTGDFPDERPVEELAAITAMVNACAATGEAYELDDTSAHDGNGSPRSLRESTDNTLGPSILCLPVNSNHGELTAALVLELSPHLPFNDQFRTYVDLVASQFHRIVVDTSNYDLEKSRREKLAEMDAAKSRLFQNISHEFRTPLTMIHGPQQSLLNRVDLNLTDDERADLVSAVRATERLQRLVDGLLEVARGQADRIVTNLEATDVPCLTEEGVAMFRAAAEAAGLDLTLTVSDDFPPALRIDRELWMRVLLNVVSNAVKYTEAGSITVNLAYTQGHVDLVIADTGVGIAESDLPYIFDRFQQARSRPVRGDAGSGIGLALVAELLRAVGGSATFESVSGEGTVATVRLPAELTTEDASASSPATERLLAGERAELDALTATAESDEPDVEPEEDAVVRGRVLVVEDNDDLRRYVTRLLRSAGWRVTATETAEAAQMAIAGHDIVLSDIMLPGMSGLDLVRWMRREADVRWTPVLLLTARAGTDSIVEGLIAGADDFVTKPFDPDELLARVATHMELSLLRKVVLDEAEDRAANLQRAVSSNRLIGTALGIVMATRKMTAEQAFTVLREKSQTSNRKLREVADEVVFTGDLPE